MVVPLDLCKHLCDSSSWNISIWKGTVLLVNVHEGTTRAYDLVTKQWGRTISFYSDKYAEPKTWTSLEISTTGQQVFHIHQSGKCIVIGPNGCDFQVLHVGVFDATAFLHNDVCGDGLFALTSNDFTISFGFENISKPAPAPRKKLKKAASDD